MVQAFVIAPGTYTAFESESELIDKCKEWGLLSEKAAKTKTFYYKGSGLNVVCSIVGYVDKMTAVIEFEDKRQHCIHPSYLKEMQASSFGQRFISAAEEPAEPEASAVAEEQQDTAAAELPASQAAEAEAPAEDVAKSEEGTNGETQAAEPPKAKAKKEKAAKIQLPEEKVKMTATVKEFTTVPNHFSDTDDEVVIYEEVSITEPETALGEAWSSYSATLKKLELEVGDILTFEAKVVAKKLTKHPVPYKINNPAKLQKQDA
ncbi:hypothetical protein ACFQ88_09640 [Paenibacillus sp. NPDC056579]|uniref:hypothetical protein n=1 Tax=Paenibacillus sp. NPDC056579 TaxID=3345871 RepID=UPI00368FE9A5